MTAEVLPEKLQTLPNKKRSVDRKKKFQKISRISQVQELLKDPRISELDVEKKGLVEKIGKELLALADVKLPLKGFSKFFAELRKADPKVKVTKAVVVEKWLKILPEEKQKLIKASYAEMKEFKVKMKEFNKKKKEILVILPKQKKIDEKPVKAALQKKAKEKPEKLQIFSAYELFKKDLEASGKVEKGRLNEEWKKLDAKGKQLYILQSLCTKEIAIHVKTMKDLELQIADLKKIN